mgnify:FL=1|jgi:single-strand DNA-binding protein|tara:strand:+ start:3329 stop:3652 length:324 start_codon:yes stop_codon:yes gene_type:complete
MFTSSIVGRLGRDAETKELSSGKKVTEFSVAVDRRKKDDGPIWVKCSYWQDTGVIQYLKKGTQVGVSGQHGISEYTKDGQDRYSVEIRVDTITLIGSNQTNDEPPLD